MCKSTSQIFTSCYLSPAFLFQICLHLLAFTVRAPCSCFKEDCCSTTLILQYFSLRFFFYKSKSLLSSCRDSKYLDRIVLSRADILCEVENCWEAFDCKKNPFPGWRETKNSVVQTSILNGGKKSEQALNTETKIIVHSVFFVMLF